MALASEGLTSLEAVPGSKVAVLRERLQACSRSSPPLPLLSDLDQQR